MYYPYNNQQNQEAKPKIKKVRLYPYINDSGSLIESAAKDD
jgi:hypothetical protein